MCTTWHYLQRLYNKPDDATSTFVQNITTYPPNCMASHTEQTPQWELQSSHNLSIIQPAPLSKVILETLKVLQLVAKLPAFHRTSRSPLQCSQQSAIPWPSIVLLWDPFQHHTPLHAYVSQMVSIPQVYKRKPSILGSLPCVSHAPPISSPQIRQS